ncbi:hypothetical protein G7046_g226 [Stylonectria norvegica]|nr:hypothetical protein G7046_g226 [Stylonectria norvegica]
MGCHHDRRHTNKSSRAPAVTRDKGHWALAIAEQISPQLTTVSLTEVRCNQSLGAGDGAGANPAITTGCKVNHEKKLFQVEEETLSGRKLGLFELPPLRVPVSPLKGAEDSASPAIAVVTFRSRGLTISPSHESTLHHLNASLLYHLTVHSPERLSKTTRAAGLKRPPSGKKKTHPEMTSNYTPEELPPASLPVLHDYTGDAWAPMCRHACSFAPHDFHNIMLNLVKNPNLNSSWLFRADIAYDDEQAVPESDAPPVSHVPAANPPQPPSVRDFPDYVCQRTLVRTLIPRNTRRDAPLDQTCSFYTSSPAEHDAVIRSLVIYIPHVSASADLPFYHPKVRGIAHLHEWDPSANTGVISIHFQPFPGEDAHALKLPRIAYHLLEILCKYGHGEAAGYVKRVHHDVVIPQSRFQDRYTQLKNKHAAALVESWAESTDPLKHVFEDLGIASFLIELWADMYKDTVFPGFVDIGCGNGLLVHILMQEGYTGWGFDARERKSWTKYKSSSASSPTGNSLERLLLLPSVVPTGTDKPGECSVTDGIQNGVFPKGTFIISNHADELTPWTPILAAVSQCPFIMIPCCSHSLTGERWRAPAPRDKTKSKSAFASLINWVTHIAEDCGWEIETEMLRIPSTRNTGLLGRRRTRETSDADIDGLLAKYGGVEGYYENVTKLLKLAPRGH